MNHARLLMVSAVMSALAACGGGGGGDAASTANSTSNANSSASATSNVTVNIDGLTMPAARQAVEQANESAGVAQQRLIEAQTALAAEQSREDAAARQQEIAAAQAEVERLREAARAEADKLVQAQAALVAVNKRDAQSAQPSPIPDCSQNAAAVDDPETGLKLVCESQITSGAATADVGTAKHASGRYYALPFPDKTMLFLGNKIGYKMACGEKICEWQKLDGSMDIVYAAQGKDGNYHRFTACRKGKADRLICAYPSTGRPDGVHVDDREPEAHRIGAAITDTDTSGWRGFRANAEISAPRTCDYGVRQTARGLMGLTHIVFPWPDRSLFRQVGEEWVAVFDGGNCLGDVRLETDSPDSPKLAQYWASAADWEFQVAGPDGKVMEPLVRFPVIRGAYQAAISYSEANKGNPTAWRTSIRYRPVSEESAAGNSASDGSASTAGTGNASGNNTAPANGSAAAPATDGNTQANTVPVNPGATNAAAPGNTTPANGAAAPQENQNAQPTPDARTTEGGNAPAGAANGAAQGGPVTSAGMFQQQRNDGAADPGTRSDSDGAFPWNGSGSTVSYGGRQITTTQQPDGSIIYRTSSGEVPFDRALDANGNVLRSVADTCKDLPEGAQECTFRAAA